MEQIMTITEQSRLALRPNQDVAVLPHVAGFGHVHVGVAGLYSLDWHFSCWTGAVLPCTGYPASDCMPDDALEQVRSTRAGYTWTGD